MFGQSRVAVLFLVGIVVMLGLLGDIGGQRAGGSTLAATPTLIPTVSSNADWTPILQEFDDVVMVFVPAGSFTMGSTHVEIRQAAQLCLVADTENTCGRSSFMNESPAHIQELTKPFWIDRTEVTRAMYRTCVDAGACSETRILNDPILEDDQPIASVTWLQAKTYCEWRGGRLPTEAEWEYAARGPDGLRYPWGNTMNGNEANHCDRNCGELELIGEWNLINEENDDNYGFIAPVGRYATDVSWVGAYDLGGNVAEWTSSIERRYPYVADDGRENGDDTANPRVLRGGTWHAPTAFLHAAQRVAYPPDLDIGLITGIRCAHD